MKIENILFIVLFGCNTEKQHTTVYSNKDSVVFINNQASEIFSRNHFNKDSIEYSLKLIEKCFRIDFLKPKKAATTQTNLAI